MCLRRGVAREDPNPAPEPSSPIPSGPERAHPQRASPAGWHLQESQQTTELILRNPLRDTTENARLRRSESGEPETAAKCSCTCVTGGGARGWAADLGKVVVEEERGAGRGTPSGCHRWVGGSPATGTKRGSSKLGVASSPRLVRARVRREAWSTAARTGQGLLCSSGCCGWRG